MSVQRGTYI